MNMWNIEVFLTEKIVFIVGVGPAFQNIENIKRRSNKKLKSGREKSIRLERNIENDAQ